MFKVYNTTTGKYIGDTSEKDIIVFFKSNGKIDRFETSMHRGREFTNRQAYMLCANDPNLSYHPTKPLN